MLKDDYLNLHVIRKMRDIVNRWFKVDIFLVDEEGRIMGTTADKPFDTTNPLFKILGQSEACNFMVTRSFSETAKKVKKQGSNEVKLYEAYAGLRRFVAPVYADGNFQGYVTAEGLRTEPFSDAEKKAIIAEMPDRNLNQAQLEEAFTKIPILSDNNMSIIRDLTKFVVEEILAFHKEISVKDKQISQLNEEIGTRYKFDAIIGRSKPMVQVYRLLDKVIDSDSTVLIYGENGTGKELIAKAIHYNSRRKDKMFVCQNCSAFNDNLLDSELFGHMRGSFTGAVNDKKGLFEMADKGTFFLDEIGDMTPALQVKLLRVLQEGTFIGVGDTKVKNVDVRIVAATNRDLKEMVEKGQFREDLYYRVNVITIKLPALRDRKEDIPLLVDHFLFKYCQNMPVRKRLSKKCMEKFFEYDFPGNIRELENEIERLVVLSDESPVIEDDMLSPRIIERIASNKTSHPAALTTSTPAAVASLLDPTQPVSNLPDAIESLERQVIEEGLKKLRWNKSKLARQLGISRRNLIRKIEKYDLDKRRRM